MNETTAARNRLETPEPFPGAAAGPSDQPSVASLVTGIVTDAQELIKQQIHMLRAEVKEDMSRSMAVARCMGASAGLLAVGALFLVIGLVPLLHDLVPSLPVWACWMIVGGVLCVGGLVAYFAGKRILDSYNPLPDKTMNALQENVQCLTNPQS